MEEWQGVLGLAALMVALFTWLRADITRLAGRIDRLEVAVSDLRERMSRLEGVMDGLRAAIGAGAAREDSRSGAAWRATGGAP